MSNENQKVNFSFGWLALKLLGKSLYSNAWSAISELVANGFDAGAKDVYVYIDISDKANAVVEIFDNGTGMDSVGIETYVKVGFNKRTDLAKPTGDDYLTMGRKGIGKLATLYLSENYYLITRTEAYETKWQMIYQENAANEDERPFLSNTTKDIEVRCKEQWETFKTGTLLQIKNVNLTGLGEVAYSALPKKLSNFFALDSMGERKIFLCFIDADNKEKSFKQVQKEIAFKNMAFINYNSKEPGSKIPEIIDSNKDNIIKFPLTKLNGNQFYKHTVVIEDFERIENVDFKGTTKCRTIEGNEVDKEYSLTGWIGLHSSIDVEQAKQNDPIFSKSKFYNPIQLRLYVRNKLAIENFLNVINNTQAFVNYIEGEINFNILDEDDLPDIATSNRQSLDEHDHRVQLLTSIVKKIVTNLITKRTDLADKIKKEEDELKNRQDDNAKRQFTKEVENEVEGISRLTEAEKASLTSIISNKIKGDIVPKSDYIIFLSHASEDKIITDFIYELLKKRGAKHEEFFYSSKNDTVDQYDGTESLGIQIKNNIVKENVLLSYLTSNSYKNSEFCMFEGGAGWATRSIGEYIVLSLTYSEIPKFITNGKLEFCLEEENKTIKLNRKTYLFIVKMLNRMITHLNAGRRANAEIEIPLFEEPSIPSDLHLSQQGKTIDDYMDKDIKEHWDFYIGKNLEAYINRRYPQEDDA